MALSVRPCELHDVEAIETILPTGPSQFHRRRFEPRQSSVYLLAREGTTAVGHVLVTPESKYDEVSEALGRFPEVNGLGVADQYRRRGVATALILAALEQSQRMGGDRLGLAVEPDNKPAVRLYESLGFVRHPTLDVVDVWTWLDDQGAEHVERDPCSYWTKMVTR